MSIAMACLVGQVACGLALLVALALGATTPFLWLTVAATAFGCLAVALP